MATKTSPVSNRKSPAKPKVAKGSISNGTLPAPVGRGRPSSYTEAVADAICDQLKDGGTLNEVCKQPGMPGEATVRSWALDDVNGFSAKYTRARELGYLKLADEILEIANTPVIGVKTVNKVSGIETTEADMIEHRRLQVDTRKWMLSKMLPKIYGDKVAVDHSGKVGMDSVPIEELTTALNDLLSKLK